MNWKKIVLWSLAVIVALVIGIGITAVLLLQHSPKFRENILAKVAQSVEDSTGARMEVKDFSLHMSALTLDIYGIIVHGSEPAGAQPLVQADHLGVGIAIDSWFGRKWHFRSITLDHPVVQVSVNKAGENNLPKPKHPSSGSSTNVFDLGVRQVVLNRGEIYYNDQKTVLLADLHDLNVTVGYDPSQTRYQGHVSYDNGKIQYGAYAPVAHNLDTGFSATPKKFTLDRMELAAGKSTVVLNATVDNFSNPAVQANYDASLVTGEFATILKNPSIPTGTVRLTGLVKYQAQPNKSPAQSASVWGMLSSPELYVRNANVHTGIRNLSAKYKVENGDADVENLHAEVLGGRLDGKATVKNFSGVGSGKVEANLNDVSLDVLQNATNAKSMREAHLVGNVSATARASWAKDISNLLAHSDVVIRAAMGNPSTPLTSEIHADYTAKNQELALRQSFIKTPQTSINLDGKISELSQLQIRMHSNDLHELEKLSANFMTASAKGQPPQKLDIFGSATLNATVSGSLKNPRVQGHLTADNLRVKGSSWKSLSTDISANPSLVTLSHGELQAVPQGHFDFNVQTHLKQWAYTSSNPIQVQLSAAQLSIADLQRLAGQSYPVAGTLALNVSLHGTQLNPVGRGDLTITNAKVSDEPIQNLSLKFQGDGKAVNTNLSVRLPAGSVEAKAILYPETQAYQAQVQMTNLRLEKLATVKAKNMQIAGGVNLNASGKGTFKNPELLATLDIPQLQVQKQSIQGTKFQTHVQNQVADISLDSNVAQTYVKGRGSVGIEAPYMTNLRLDTGRISFAPLLALYAPAQAPDASGETELHVSVKGPLQDKNKVEAHLEIPVLKASYKQLQLGAAKPIRIDYQNDVAVLQPTSIEGTGTNIQAEATIPVNNPNAATVLAKGTIDLQIAQMLSPDLQSKGLIRFDIDSRRYGSNSNINGQIRLENASLRTADAPLGLDDANGVITVTKERMEITSFQGRVGGGTISATGRVNYRPALQFDLAMAANQIRLRYPDGLRTVLDSNLSLTGNAQASTLGGLVKIQHISFTPDFDLASFTDQFSSGGESAPSPGFAQTVKLNIAIQSTSQMDLSSSQVSVRGNANLRVAGTAAEPVILGRTTLTGGEIFEAGNRYVIQNGTIDFMNPVRTDPVVNLQAQTVINQYNILINIQGPVERLQTSFNSDPALPPVDIINLIARGQTTEQQAAAPSQSLAGGAQSLLAQQASSQVGNRVAKFAGLSHVSIDPALGNNNQDPGARIAIQQRVTSNLYVTYATDVTSTQRQAIELEYQLNRKWSLSGVRDQNGGYGVDAHYKKSF